MINKILYNSVGLGGTFDHFHEGHKSFIKFAASFSRELTIGVTSKKMTLTKPFHKMIESAQTRSNAVKKFCHEEGIKAKIIELNDELGPTIEKKTVQAIACTTDNLRGAERINEIRSKLDMKELPIHIHKLLQDKSNSGPINSSRIRNGEIDREGNVYSEILGENLKLNEDQRNYFSKPQGQIIVTPNEAIYFSCVVGDYTLEKFINNKWQYDLGIFDGKQKRVEVASKVLSKLKIDYKTSNNPGLISQKLSMILKNWTDKTNFKHIYVDGEEDLAAVALIMLLPLGSNIYYGQPDQGIVEMRVTEGLKHNVSKILKPNLSRK